MLGLSLRMKKNESTPPSPGWQCIIIEKQSNQFGFQDQLWLDAGQEYYRLLQGEHSALLSTFIKLLFVVMILVLSISERPFYTGINDNKDSEQVGEIILYISYTDGL